MIHVKKFSLCLAAVLMSGMPLTTLSAPITTLDSQPWVRSFATDNGTAEIVSLTGVGGRLENGSPSPSGAVRLKTSTTGESHAQIELRPTEGFGKVGELFNADLVFEYSAYKGSTGAEEPAPALKLGFQSGADFTHLIFEPYWNQEGAEGESTAVPVGEWTDYTISLNEGVWWTTGGFGQTDSEGGPPLRNLADWLTVYDVEFANADLFSVSLGLGPNNPGQIGYVDNVNIHAGDYSKNFDFETAAEVPAPATLPLLVIGLAGVIATRRRRTLD